MTVKKKASRPKQITPPVSEPEDGKKIETEEASADETGAPVAPPKHSTVFPIVGIGASAGGLAAFEGFFSGMPADVDPGMAFVLVQHLAPDHKSILTDLLRRYTSMQVLEVEDGMTVQPNCIYIIPPGCDMAFLNGTLQLLEPILPRGQRLPIDFFFRSLAQDQRERAIGIVLSGTGSDGTLGLRAIKGEGGMIMAQTPESTEYDGMPRSAINTGLVDYQLSPAEMPTQLMAYAGRVIGHPRRPIAPSAAGAENSLKKIFILLRSHTGHDFSGYKSGTIDRRIERRLAIHQIESLEKYVGFLQRTPTEIDSLFRDLLIGVTSFFRDPEAFTFLEKQIIPKLLNGRPSESAIRVWVPGCSTGEEAYSIAILLAEWQEVMKKRYQVQVFASDIDSRAITTARAGIYPASVATDISAERFRRFFVAEPGGTLYRIQKNIRDMLVFSEQNIIKDPPFSKLDLISCRNLLIYLNSSVQKKIIPMFHYALNPKGFLFLGTSETSGEFVNIFNTLERRLKVFQRKEHIFDFKTQPLSFFQPPIAKFARDALPTGGSSAQAAKLPLRELTEQALLQVAPAAILVNKNGDILYLHGRTGKYLEPPPGEVGVNNILKMAREGLRQDLTTALHKAVVGKGMVHCPGLQVKTNGDYTAVDLTLKPIISDPAESTRDLLVLVILAPAISTNIAGPMVPEPGCAADQIIYGLRQELRAKEEYLQVTNAQLETTNEELRSSNEEMQSVNEELQSTNEELETSKEELQSVNEELATVNNELQTKVADLSQANNDMNNLLAGTGIGTIFVDHDLSILRFTPTATRMINLIANDLGRPVGHIVSNLVGYDNLVADIKKVLDTLIPQEVEVHTVDDRWYTMRIQPYRTLDNVIEGAVITFMDTTQLIQFREKLEKANEMANLVVVSRDAADAIVVQDLKERIIAWNPAAVRLYGWTEAEALTMKVGKLIPDGQGGEVLAKIRKLSQAQLLEPYRTERLAKDGTVVEVWLTATALLNEAGQMYAITTTERISRQ